MKRHFTRLTQQVYWNNLNGWASSLILTLSLHLSGPELVEFLPVTDQILMVHFDDGFTGSEHAKPEQSLFLYY